MSTSISDNPDRDYPETMILEPGQSVDGTFERLERGVTKDGAARAIAILTIAGIERSLWLHETALRLKFRDLRPEPGERVVVTKGGEKRLSETTGRFYWPFKVSAPDRPVETPDWDSGLLLDDDAVASASKIDGQTGGDDEPLGY